MPSLRDGILKLASADLSIVENNIAYRTRGKAFFALGQIPQIKILENGISL